MSSSEFVEAVVGKVSDLKDGEMKEVDLGEGKALLVKEKGKIFAVGHKCTHYGAALKTGALCDGRIRCPWHGACFSVETGDIEDFPGLDSIHTFQVEIRGEEILVRAPTKALVGTGNKRVKTMCSKAPEDNRVFVIIGGGAGGATCAETLRQEGFTGRIVMVCKEKHLPYDRPKLSKAMSTTVDKILMRPKDFYDGIQVELILGAEAVDLDPAAMTVKLSNGAEIKYDNCFVSTGGTPRTVPAPGMELGNIYPLRNPEDSLKINETHEGKRVVVVGSSFIGMEVAACIAKKTRSIIVVGMETVPFERVLGPQLGAVLQKFHEKNGVVFRMKRVVKEFRGVNGLVTQVLLDNGEALDADIVVVGAGVIPTTKFIKPGSVTIERDQSIVVDQFLKAAPGLYAGGDIARYKYHLTGESVRIEHWGMAQNHGKVAARNMVGKATPVEHVPFFWTTQYGKSIRYCGHALQFDEFILSGSPDDMNFLAIYGHKGKVHAAAGVGKDQVIAAIAELLAANKMPSVDEIKATKDFDFVKYAASL